MNFNDNNTAIETLCIKDVSLEEYEKYYSLLSEHKKKRVSAYKFERDKRLSVCAEMLAKKMLAKRLSLKPENILILADSYGKPYAENTDIHFNISHSADLVACAVSKTPVGIDIQIMRDVDDKLINYVCCDDEKKYVFENPDLKQKRFFEIWTAKEAYFKCLGSGISDPKSINVLDIKGGLNTKFTDDYALSVYQQNT